MGFLKKLFGTAAVTGAAVGGALYVKKRKEEKDIDEDIFEDFLEFFSSIPCLMTFPVKSILQEEYACYLEGKAFKFTNQIAYAFTPYLEKESYNCKSFFNNLKNLPDFVGVTDISGNCCTGTTV